MPYLASWERDAQKEGMKQGIEQGVKQGVKQGVEQGVNKEKMRTAKLMIKEGIDPDTIVKITGLDRKQIEKMLATSH
jgi:predicted transposase/invertase (TIGR01784 family)